jgi:anti-sigma B factor antagonist
MGSDPALTGLRQMETKAGLHIAREGNVAIASFKNACISDAEEISHASTQLRQYIHSDPPRRVVFDFQGVKFFSSQVLGLLLEARAHLRPHDGDVAITSLSPQLQRVFKVTNLDRIFRLYPDRAAAVQPAAGQVN